MQTLRDEQRERACKAGPEERVCGDGGSAVFGEGVDEVVERGLEDGEEADAD